MEDSFNSNFKFGSWQDPLIDLAEPSNPEKLFVLEAIHSHVEIFICELVRPMLVLPIFKYHHELGLPHHYECDGQYGHQH